MPEIILTFVHLSDTHISSDPDYGRPETPHTTQQGARALVQQVNALPFKVDFILHTGDVVYDPELEPYHTARDILGQLQQPVYYVRGNHDYSAGLQRVLLGQDTAKDPFYYEFEVNGVQATALPNRRAAT